MLLKKGVYNAKIKDIEDKVPDITNLATTAALNGKTNEVKGKIPSITNLATTTGLTALGNQKLITETQKLIKFFKKITDHDYDKYVTTPEFNKLTAENLAVELC